VGVWVSLGSYNVAQSADLNFLPDHLMAVIRYMRPNRATLRFLGTGVVEMTTLRLWLKRMAYQRVLATTSDRIPDSPMKIRRRAGLRTGSEAVGGRGR
jgi:hypothetical protein